MDADTNHLVFLESKIEYHYMANKNRLSTLARKSETTIFTPFSQNRLISDLFNPNGEAKCGFCILKPADFGSFLCCHLLCGRCAAFLPGRCPACRKPTGFLVSCNAEV